MIGMTKSEVLNCAGIPDRKQELDELEQLVYERSGDSDASFVGGIVNVRNRDCKVTVMLSEGKVTKVKYGGNSGGLLTEDEQCAYIVEDCVKD